MDQSRAHGHPIIGAAVDTLRGRDNRHASRGGMPPLVSVGFASVGVPITLDRPAQSSVSGRHHCPRSEQPIQFGGDPDLHGPVSRGARIRLSQGSALPGVVCLREDTSPHLGTRLQPLSPHVEHPQGLLRDVQIRHCAISLPDSVRGRDARFPSTISAVIACVTRRHQCGCAKIETISVRRVRCSVVTLHSTGEPSRASHSRIRIVRGCTCTTTAGMFGPRKPYPPVPARN
jgi:hypothetical protein